MTSLDIHAGDFPERTRLALTGRGAKLQLPWKSGDGWGVGEQLDLNKSTVKDFSVASEETIKKFGRAAGMSAAAGVAGAIIAGPLLAVPAMMAGALAGGRKKNVTFVLELNDGRRMLATTDSKSFEKLQAALF
ncbi:MAG: hypothetical protein QG597_1632 [Actinomycetota bacterium]|nr:hypothetical protein [Actinomycetota bacterium]